ncbi:MAG: hypothetical protein PSX81_01675 [bacterium]|nr:hypothetical protein [bacterium]
MTKKQILVIGRHQETMEKVLHLINAHENWIGKGSITDENAIEMCNNNTFDMALLGGGIEVESGIKLRAAFTEKNPDIIIFQHFGAIGTLISDMEAAMPKEAA